MILPKFKLLLSGFMLLIACQLFAQSSNYDRAYYQAFPDYRELTTHYVAAHPEVLSSTEYFLHFEKRQKGWFVVKKSFEADNKIIERTQIWDAEKKEYLFKFAPNQSPHRQYANGEFEYYLLPFYGYDEASQDIVKLLGNIPYKELNADELEALARSYENMAYGDFRKQQNSVLERYDSTLSPKDIRPEVIAAAEKNAWKSIEVFEYLAQHYPEHLSIVGDMKIKLANSYLFHYMIFQNIQQPQIAQKFIEKAVYSKEIISNSKNILKSCPPNAILISYGDNDSYPLWYLQQQEGIRTDVTILNQIQLSLGRYIYYNSTLLQKVKRPKMTLGIRHYIRARNNYCKLIEGSSDFSEFLNKLEQDQKYNDEIRRIEIPKDITLGKGETQISLHLNGGYLYKNELVILDLISSNWPKRPFCFVPQHSSTLYNAIRPYLKTHGLVRRLQKNYDKTDSYFPSLDQEATEELLLNEFEWGKAPKEATYLQKLLPSASSLQYLYYYLIQQKLEQQNKKAAKKLFLSYTKRDIFKKMSNGQIHLYFALMAEELELPKKRDEQLLAYMDELEVALEKAKKEAKTAYERCYPAQDEASIQLKITEAINFCRLRDWDQWVERYQKHFNR